MSTPPISLKATGKVADAAICMTEHKARRGQPATASHSGGSPSQPQRGQRGGTRALAAAGDARPLLCRPPTRSIAADRRPCPLPLCPQFHRVPVVDDDGKCVGIVTRSDIFWALTQADQEADEESPLSQHGLAL